MAVPVPTVMTFNNSAPLCSAYRDKPDIPITLLSDSVISTVCGDNRSLCSSDFVGVAKYGKCLANVKKAHVNASDSYSSSSLLSCMLNDSFVNNDWLNLKDKEPSLPDWLSCVAWNQNLENTYKITLGMIKHGIDETIQFSRNTLQSSAVLLQLSALFQHGDRNMDEEADYLFHPQDFEFESNGSTSPVEDDQSSGVNKSTNSLETQTNDELKNDISESFVDVLLF